MTVAAGPDGAVPGRFPRYRRIVRRTTRHSRRQGMRRCSAPAIERQTAWLQACGARMER